MDMRVLIHGQAALGEARIDQRANAPAFRLRRTAVLRNVDIDMTGFREALLVEGGPGVKPFVQRCVIRCEVLTAAASSIVSAQSQARASGWRH